MPDRKSYYYFNLLSGKLSFYRADEPPLSSVSSSTLDLTDKWNYGWGGLQFYLSLKRKAWVRQIKVDTGRSIIPEYEADRIVYNRKVDLLDLEIPIPEEVFNKILVKKTIKKLKQ